MWAYYNERPHFKYSEPILIYTLACIKIEHTYIVCWVDLDITLKVVSNYLTKCAKKKKKNEILSFVTKKREHFFLFGRGRMDKKNCNNN